MISGNAVVVPAALPLNTRDVTPSGRLPTTRDELYAGLAVGALFLLLLALTWQRWTHPIVDHGREMNIPLRILAGERLYVDIVYYYGPLAPHLNALLYKTFGIHLTILHLVGGFCAIVSMGLIHWLARRVLSPWESAISTSAVVVTCALNVHLGNYIQPYAYATLFGWLAALASLSQVVRQVELQSHAPLRWAGAWIGVALACKPELALLSGIPVCVSLAVQGASNRRFPWLATASVAAPVTLVTMVVYSPLVAQVPWDLLVADSYSRFGQPQMVYFGRYLSGLLQWPFTGWAIVAAMGSLLCLAGLGSIFGILADAKSRIDWRAVAKASVFAATGFALWSCERIVPMGLLDHSPLRAAPIVLCALWLVLARRTLSGPSAPVSQTDTVLLLYTSFALGAITRVPLSVSLETAYTPFTVPLALVILAFVLFRMAPRMVVTSKSQQRHARRFAMSAAVAWLAVLAAQNVVLCRSRNVFLLKSPRGSLMTTPQLGQPIQDALEFLDRETCPNDPVGVLPQGSILHFMSGRANPLREETVVPGFMEGPHEQAAIQRLSSGGVRIILITNFGTPEYRDVRFGVDYNRALMEWIRSHYRLSATFVSALDKRRDDGSFSIAAYERVSSESPVSSRVPAPCRRGG